MMVWLWGVIGILVCINLFLAGKVYFLHKAAREIQTGFAEKLLTETNTLLTLSSRDKYMQELADGLNAELRKLRGWQAEAETARRYLDVMENRAAAMKRLTEELFQYSIAVSTAQDASLEEVVLNHVLEESIIFENIINNAVKYSAKVYRAWAFHCKDVDRADGREDFS